MFTQNTTPPSRVFAPAVAAALGVALYWVAPVTGYLFAGGLLLAAAVLTIFGTPTAAPTPDGQGSAEPNGPDSMAHSGARLRLLESAVVHANDAVVILDAQVRGPQGRAVLYANKAFCRMTGYTRDEVIGRSLYFLRGPASDTGTLSAICDAFATGRSLQVELRNYRKDGTEFWVDLSLVPVPDPVGGAAHWVMIQRDITDRKGALDALRRSETLFRRIFENTTAGVVLTDGRGRVVSCNPAFAALTGRTVQDLVGTAPAAITHPDDLAAQKPLMGELLAGTRDRFHLSKRYIRPNGEAVWAEVSVAAVRGPNGEFEYGLGVALNVTERRRLEEQLLHAQKMEAVGRMAGGVAHDFNNLLTGLLGNLAQIRLADTHPNAVHLAVVEQAANRAADLTGKLLGYARRNQLVSVPVHPADAFGDAVSLVRHTFDPRIEVVALIADDCGRVLADPTLLGQVLLNLCLNARDAMPGGGTLTLSANSVEVTDADARESPGEARPGSFVRLSVADTGCGMTDAVKARLFEPFFTTKETGKGTGLGLPMVQGIVKQHHGWVTCASAPSEGTRIDVYLPPAEESAAGRPVVRTPPPSPVAAEQRTPMPMPSPLPAAPRPGNGETILLVDDEPMIRDIARAVLEGAGFRVALADDGVAAVETFRDASGQFSLVVLDVTMPRMSGRDAFRHLVEFDPNVKVLFSTGYSSEVIEELDGAAGLLSKPYRPHELLAAVQAAIKGERVMPTP